MKEIITVLTEKLKQVEPTIAAIIICVGGLFTIGMITVIASKFLTTVISIVEVFGSGGSPKSF